MAAVVVAITTMATTCGAPEPRSEPAASSVPSATEPEEPADSVDAVDSVDPAASGDSAAAGAGFDWQGHRGARGLRPENTLPSFELALDLGVDTLELDLHLSADYEVVVWHDPVIEADKCQGDGVGRPVRDLTATQLRELRCASNPDPGRYPEQRPEPGQVSGDDFGIVTLVELLGFVDDYARHESKSDEQRRQATAVGFNIETKRKPDDPGAIGDGFDGSAMGVFEEAVMTAVMDGGVEDRVTVQSFDHRSLWAVHQEHPAVELAALTRRDDRPDLGRLAEMGATVWSPDHRSLSPEVIDQAHAAGLIVIPWTVNDPDDMEQLVAAGVDGIITDRPDLRPTETG